MNSSVVPQSVASVRPPAGRAAFDQQGQQSDDARVAAAMASFVSDFSRTVGVHLETCVHCGLCAQACHFHITTGHARYTPIYKLEPFRRAYQREASPFAPLVRAFNLVEAPTIGDLQQWQELIYDACTLCGRCTTVCPMGIDIAELIRDARHGMFKAGLIPERLALMDRTARQWGSPATPAEDLPDILAEVSREHGVEIPCDLAQADILVTAAPAELGEHTKALADAAKILHRSGARWTMHSCGFDASNVGFNNGDLELQERLTRALIDTAVAIGAHTVLLPECGHAYGAARWEAARWYGRAPPVRVIHMTEFRRVAGQWPHPGPAHRRHGHLPRSLPDRSPRRPGGRGAARAGGPGLCAARVGRAWTHRHLLRRWRRRGVQPARHAAAAPGVRAEAGAGGRHRCRAFGHQLRPMPHHAGNGRPAHRMVQTPGKPAVAGGRSPGGLTDRLMG
jgi:ferredoxin